MTIPELRTDFLRRIDGEIDRLAAMIAELLDLAAAEADRASHQFERVNLGDLVRQSAERLRPQAERGGVGLAIESPRAVLTVSADPAQTDRMVVNLLHNAIKFTPPGGQVRVSVQVEDGEAVVRVQDTGVGIDAEELPRVFERFYKVDPSRASEGFRARTGHCQAHGPLTRWPNLGRVRWTEPGLGVQRGASRRG